MKKPKLVTYFLGVLSLFIVLSGCKDSNEAGVLKNMKEIGQGNFLEDISTNLAAYHPEKPVAFELLLNEEIEDGKLNIVYKHLNEAVSEQEVEIDGQKQLTWEWTSPGEDFKGYMAEVYLEKSNKVMDYTTIGVDVSSN